MFERLVNALDSLHCRLDDLIQREQTQLATIDRLEGQLREAGAMQRAFLPDRLPVAEGIDIEVLYRPAEHVSGDIYDVYRVDDSHIAFAIADATGHGLSAGLLSALIRRSLRGSAGAGPASRLVEPDEVLRRVNEDIAGLRLEDCQFVAALFAVYDEKTRVIEWARGGAPYPLLDRKGQPLIELKSEGPLVGACEAPRFEVAQLRLEPGDRLIFFSDGIENHIDLLASHRNADSESERVSHPAETVDPLARLKAAMWDDAQGFKDDVTVLMIEADPSHRPRAVRDKSTPSTGLAYSRNSHHGSPEAPRHSVHPSTL